MPGREIPRNEHSEPITIHVLLKSADMVLRSVFKANLLV